MSEQVKAKSERLVLLLFAELSRPEQDQERLTILRTEVREALVDPVLDSACQTCLEPLSGDDSCDWCGAR